MSAEPVIIDRNFTSLPLGKKYDFREDVSGKLTINDIAGKQGGASLSWKRAEEEALSKGYVSSAYWLRFTLANPEDRETEVIVHETYPLINDIAFYYPASDGSYRVIETGTRYKFSHRPVNNRAFAFPLVLKPRSSATLYLRAITTGSINLPVMIYSPAGFNEASITETLLLWMLYGMLIIMTLYHLAIFIFIREDSYLFYSLYVFFFTLIAMSLNGHASQYLWPNQVWWGNMCRPVFLGLIIAFLCLFGRSFMNVRHYSPAWDTVLLVIVGAALLLIITAFPVDSYRFSILSTMILAGIAILNSYSLAIYLTITQKSRQAVIFLASFTMFFLGTFAYLMKSFGIIMESNVSHYSMLAGAIIQAVMFSLGMGDTIKTLKDDLQSLNLRIISGTERKRHRIISPTVKEKMLKAIAYIEENYRYDISREGLAAHLGINSDDLGRYFKFYTGKKVNDYCNELRIEEAARLMRETDTSMADIAFSVGFESLSTFNRAFFKVMNMTPSKYKDSEAISVCRKGIGD